jgi:hypothetical protein
MGFGERLKRTRPCGMDELVLLSSTWLVVQGTLPRLPRRSAFALCPHCFCSQRAPCWGRLQIDSLSRVYPCAECSKHFQQVLR